MLYPDLCVPVSVACFKMQDHSKDLHHSSYRCLFLCLCRRNAEFTIILQNFIQFSQIYTNVVVKARGLTAQSAHYPLHCPKGSSTANKPEGQLACQKWKGLTCLSSDLKIPEAMEKMHLALDLGKQKLEAVVLLLFVEPLRSPRWCLRNFASTET